MFGGFLLGDKLNKKYLSQQHYVDIKTTDNLVEPRFVRYSEITERRFQRTQFERTHDERAPTAVICPCDHIRLMLWSSSERGNKRQERTDGGTTLI